MTRHSLKLHIAWRSPDDPGIVATKDVRLRERLMCPMLGTPRKVMILVPGDSVKQIDITKTPTMTSWLWWTFSRRVNPNDDASAQCLYS